MTKPNEPLTFDQLRAACDAREPEWERDRRKGALPLPLSYHSNELAGETGELCNEIKKIERVTYGLVGGKGDNHEALADEMGDVIISVALLARKLGVDLGEAVRRKFNKTSVKHDFVTKI